MVIVTHSVLVNIFQNNGKIWEIYNPKFNDTKIKSGIKISK